MKGDYKGKNGRRRPDIVFLNVLFCFFVIFIHAASEIVSSSDKNNALFLWVYVFQKLSMFVVPGFILLSGVKLFMHKADDFNIGKFYLTRFLRVIVPYLFWAVIYYAYFCMAGVYKFDSRDMVRRIISGDIWAHFYFVIVLVQFEVLAPLWIVLFKKGSSAVHAGISMLVTAICAQYLPSILTTLIPSFPDFNVSNCFLRYQIYWTAGCLIGKNYQAFCESLKSNKIRITLGFILSGGLYAYIAIFTMGHEPVWTELFGILYNCFAILFFYTLSQMFCGRGAKLLKVLTPIDRSTYTIYLLHCLVIVFTDDYMKKRGIFNLADRFSLRIGVVYAVCILVCVIWYIIKLPLAKRIKKAKQKVWYKIVI